MTDRYVSQTGLNETSSTIWSTLPLALEIEPGIWSLQLSVDVLTGPVRFRIWDYTMSATIHECCGDFWGGQHMEFFKFCAPVTTRLEVQWMSGTAGFCQMSFGSFEGVSEPPIQIEQFKVVLPYDEQSAWRRILTDDPWGAP